MNEPVKKRTRSKKVVEPKKQQLFIALKDFLIVQNDYMRNIRKGDDLSNLPERFLDNMRTEGVL